MSANGSNRPPQVVISIKPISTGGGYVLLGVGKYALLEGFYADLSLFFSELCYFITELIEFRKAHFLVYNEKELRSAGEPEAVVGELVDLRDLNLQRKDVFAATTIDDFFDTAIPLLRRYMDGEDPLLARTLFVYDRFR